MATKRPVSLQRITQKTESTESSTTQVAASETSLPSNLNLRNAAVEPRTAAIEGGLKKPSTEQTIAESTTPEQQVKPGIDVGSVEGRATPADTLPGRPAFNLTDAIEDVKSDPGPNDDLPAREELEARFFSEVGMHPIGAGEAGPPTDPAAAREFFAEHGKGSLISADAEPTVVKQTRHDDGLIVTEYSDGAKEWNMPWGTTVVSERDGTTALYDKNGELVHVTHPEGTKIPEDPDPVPIEPLSAQPSVIDTVVDTVLGWFSQPGSESEYAPLPEDMQDAIDAELARLGQLAGRQELTNSPAVDPNNTDPTDDADPGFGTGEETDNPPETLANGLLGGDDLFGDAGPGSASAGDVRNRNEWAINMGPEHANPQSKGRERDMFERKTVDSDWSDRNTGDTSVDSGYSPFSPVVVDSPYDDVPEELEYEMAG